MRVFYSIVESDVVIKGWSKSMAHRTRKKMTKVPLSEMKNNLSEFIHKAGSEDVVVTIHGRPVAVIIGF
ncbi:MAG: type II toxin-antitoxin system Phd/YefM family antitoxin [Chloracidobacterium sp.]|nr:type II toxin-antitoxin system Phd/YefM family antitoxin [Chloracidobacterium sp.]